MMTNTPRSCDQLGICQHKIPPCPGECQMLVQQPQPLPIHFAGPEPEPLTTFEGFLATVGDWVERAILLMACAAMAGLTAGFVLGVAMLLGKGR